MAEQVVSGDSKQAVAYALLLSIAHQEKKITTISGVAIVTADKDWVLNTYKECLAAVDSI